MKPVYEIPGIFIAEIICLVVAVKRLSGLGFSTGLADRTALGVRAGSATLAGAGIPPLINIGKVKHTA